jgi:hypothetical protein
MHWRNGLVNSALVVGSTVITLLVIETVLRFLPIDWKVPIFPPTADDPIQRYTPNAPFVSSIGWNLSFVVRSRTNAQGWLADYDYDETASTPLIAVIGDSHIEGWGVPLSQSVTGRLQAALGAKTRVYAFAQSGAPLSQYVAYARHACAIYHPESLIVSVGANDFDESLYARRSHNGFFHLYQRPDGQFDHKLTPFSSPVVIQNLARHSALAVYLLRNVGVNELIRRVGIHPIPTPTHVENRSAEARSERLRDSMRVIDWFVDALPGAACLPPKSIMLVIDALRPQIYGGDAGIKAAENSYFARMRVALMTAAKAKGYLVVDMEPRFRAAFAADGKRFEFPTDRHWNAHGHAIVAAAVFEALAR